MVLHGDHIGDEKFPEFVGLHFGLDVENFGQVVVIFFARHTNGHFLAHHVAVAVVQFGIQVDTADLS